MVSSLRLTTRLPPTRFAAYYTWQQTILLTLLQTFETGVEFERRSLVGRGEIPTDAIDYITQTLGVDKASVEYNSGFSRGDARHAYIKQRLVRSSLPFPSMALLMFPLIERHHCRERCRQRRLQG